VVSSVVALLIDAGRKTDLGNDPQQTTIIDRSGRSVVNAERSETIKAALLAGSRRLTFNSSSAQISDYRRDPANQGANGLDTRFGAGQLNVYNSYHIIAGGEQNNDEDDETSGTGTISSKGFDVDPFFGGLSDSNTTGTYRFTAGADDRRLYAALVWNLKIDGGTWDNFNDTATFYDLDLILYDTTAGSDRLVATSVDDQNNTENLWTAIVPGRSYRLEVTGAQGQSDFLWDYALAWRMDTPADSDGDGIEDEWEVEYGLDHTTAADMSQDDDEDGLGALEEYQQGTSPNNEDTDGDGVPDGEEISRGADPLDSEDYPIYKVPGTSIVALVTTAWILIGMTTFVLGRKSKRP
jgi:hypothetical protein